MQAKNKKRLLDSGDEAQSGDSGDEAQSGPHVHAEAKHLFCFQCGSIGENIGDSSVITQAYEDAGSLVIAADRIANDPFTWNKIKVSCVLCVISNSLSYLVM